jgi:hypothetical protein
MIEKKDKRKIMEDKTEWTATRQTSKKATPEQT